MFKNLLIDFNKTPNIAEYTINFRKKVYKNKGLFYRC